MKALQNSEPDNMLPLAFRMSQNYPNPFRDRTMIKYCVARRIRVRLTVYDSTGKTIRQLVDEEKRAGTYEVEFLTAVGSGHLASGEYTYRMEAGEFCCEKSMELVNQPVSRVDGEGEGNSDFAGSDDPRASCS